MPGPQDRRELRNINEETDSGLSPAPRYSMSDEQLKLHARAQELAEAERDLARTRATLSGEEAPDNFVSDTVEDAAGYGGESCQLAKNGSSVALMATGGESSPEPAPTASVVENPPEPESGYNLPSAMTGEPELQPVSPMPAPHVGDERDSEFPIQTPDSTPASEIVEVAPPSAPSAAPAAEPEPSAASPDSIAVPTLDTANTVPAPAPAQETPAAAAAMAPPAPVSAPSGASPHAAPAQAVPVVDGDTNQKPRRVKFTPITKRPPAPVSAPPNLSPDKPASVAAAEAQVKAVAADGEVTAAEAGETASAAGKVLNAAEADTPDSPEPKRSYDSGDDIARLVEEICNDPARMQELLERAKLSRHKAQREQADDDGQTVSPEARSAAGKVLNRLRQDSPSPPEAGRKSQKARISDVDLLRRAVNKCKITDPSGPPGCQGSQGIPGGQCTSEHNTIPQ